MKRKNLFKKYMLRPLIYLAAFRLMVALLFLLILVRFVKNGPAPDLVCGFLAIFFALLAYLVYLRMDGLRIPRVKYIRPKKKQDPLRSFGAMSDHVDDDPGVSFEELEEDERIVCKFLSDIICFAVFMVPSIIVLIL